MSTKQAAQVLLDTIDTGWNDETLIDEIEYASDDLGLCPADIGLLRHHIEGTDNVRNQVVAMLKQLTTNP